jgi:hypothetical protein
VKCLTWEQISCAVTDGAKTPHLLVCLDCRRRFDQELTIRNAVRGLQSPAMSESHRREMAAEVVARAQQLPAPRYRGLLQHSRAVVFVGVGLAAAASLIFVTTGTTRGLHSSNTAPDASRATPPLVEASAGAVLSRQVGVDRDELRLNDGTLSVDTRTARNVDVRVGDSVIRVDDASVKIKVQKRSIVSVQVAVGAAKITSPDQRVTIQRDSMWLPGPSTKQQSLAAFRDGWVALREGRNRDAIALFDSVADPVAKEEASYWAAVAAKRAGDSGASQRFENFRTLFPLSQFLDQIGTGTP